MSKPKLLFRKGDALVWTKKNGLDSGHWIDKYGPGPFVCPEDVVDYGDGTYTIMQLTTSPELNNFYVGRFEVDPFLTKVQKALALSTRKTQPKQEPNP